MCLLTKFNGDGNVYLDPVVGVKLTVSPFNLEVEQVEAAEIPRLSEDWSHALNAYLQGSYCKGGKGLIMNQEGDKIAICLVGNRFNTSNFWNGQWRSTWSYDGQQLTGNISVRVHYFEDGNIQLNTGKSGLTIEAQNTPLAIFEAIGKAEDDVQFSINDSYHQLSETVFKRLRRQLPMTRAKVEWAKLATYKVGDELAKK